MNNDSHVLSEMYRQIKEQQLVGFGVSQGPKPQMGQFNVAMQSAGGADNMKANKMVDDLMKEMNIDVKHKTQLLELLFALANKK